MKGKKIYIVGIGGIGLSALAQLFLHEGASVSGSDRSESPTTAMLRAAGVTVHIGHNATQVPEEASMIVYTDAIIEGSEGYAERVQGRELGIPELSYFEALGAFASGKAPFNFQNETPKKVIAISGTNGKTTTTAMLAKILIDAGEDPTVVVGSIAADMKSNFRAGKSNLFVVEACEYKRHFLTFNPHLLVITNIELDHTDYFKDEEDFIRAFKEVVANVDDGGDIVTNPHSINVAKAIADTSKNIVDYTKEDVPELLQPGEFNRENARAAKAAVHALAPHIKDSVIDESLKTFRGTWRRFEYKGILPHGAMLYDDYAHHPSAIEKTLITAREKFPNKKIAVFFHPHLYSRTRDLFDEFARTLALADEAYVLPVFAAREAFDMSVSNEALANEINKKRGKAQAIEGMVATTQKLRTLDAGVIAFTMGAGDVYKAGEEALK